MPLCGMDVVGRVSMNGNGPGTFQFRRKSPDPPVVVQPSSSHMLPPSVEVVKARILADGWQLHASRTPLTNTDMKIQISNVQRQPALKLVPEPKGSWSDDAWQKL